MFVRWWLAFVVDTDKITVFRVSYCEFRYCLSCRPEVQNAQQLLDYIYLAVL